MQPDSPTLIFDIAVATIGVVPLLVLIVTLFTYWKARQGLVRLEENRRGLAEILGMAAVTQAALARCEDSTAKLREAIERLEHDNHRFLEAQRSELEQVLVKFGASSNAMEQHAETARQLQFAFRNTIDHLEQSSGRVLAAQQAVFQEARDQLSKTAILLATPANGAGSGRLLHAANWIRGLMRGARRLEPALKPPEPQPGETIDAENIPDHPSEPHR